MRESVEGFLSEFIPKNSWDYYSIIQDPDTGTMDPKRWDQFVDKSYSARKNIPVEEQWGQIAMSFGTADNLKNAIVKDLKKKGYNAMVDEAGVGGRNGQAVEGIDPIIIFDSSVLTVNNTREISRREEQKSESDYLKWVQRARKSGNW